MSEHHGVPVLAHPGLKVMAAGVGLSPRAQAAAQEAANLLLGAAEAMPAAGGLRIRIETLVAPLSA